VSRRGAGLAVAAALLVACAWLTYLLPPLFAAREYSSSRHYDAQFGSLLHLRWDVPRSETGAEAFEVDGRYYLYFGPTPAFLRLLVAEPVARFPWKAGFVSLFLAAALGLWAGVRVGEEASGREAGPFEVAALGALTLAVASRPSVYHEAIAWGGALALLAALQALRYVRAPGLARLAAVGACAALAALARETWLLAAAALLGGLAVAALVDGRRGSGAPARAKRWLGLPDPARPAAHAALALAMLGLLVLGLAGIHRAKFGTWGLVAPISRHMVFQDPGRLARIGGGMFHLANLPSGLYNYLSPTSAAVGRSFPWIGPTHQAHLFPGTRIDGVEHLFGLPYVGAALLLLGALGAVAARRTPAVRPVLLLAAALALSSASILLFVGYCGRYLYDFYPTLATAAAAGLVVLRARPRPRLRALFRGLTAVNLAAGISMVFVIQRDNGHYERRAQLERLTARIDALTRLR
jgi:hypothetical protein